MIQSFSGRAIFLLLLGLTILPGGIYSYGQSKDTIFHHRVTDTVLPKIDSLKEVVVRPTALRPYWRGDTMEFNTNIIQIRANANVEELLGRLPGLHIDANGRITYNGEVIKQTIGRWRRSFCFGPNPRDPKF